MVSVLSGAVLAYLVIQAVRIAGGTTPLVPWSLPILLGFLSVVAWFYTRSFRSRLAQHRVSPEEGVRALVLGKSMLMTGAVLAGGHLVYVLVWIGQTDIPGPRARVIHGAVTLVAAITFGVVGGWLERNCVVDAGDGEGPEQPA